MKNYEGVFILKPDLGKEALEKTLGQVKELIAKNNGSISEIKEWGKQRLAYPIKKHQEGVYYLTNFNITSDGVSKLRRSFALNESILRVLIISV